VNFVADESVERQTVDRLRQEGHTVWYVAEMDPGISDSAVLDSANQRSALLLTADKNFGELVFRQRRLASGVMLIRLAGLSLTAKAEIVASTISKSAGELPHAFTVISPGAIRIRRQSAQG